MRNEFNLTSDDLLKLAGARFTKHRVPIHEDQLMELSFDELSIPAGATILDHYFEAQADMQSLVKTIKRGDELTDKERRALVPLRILDDTPTQQTGASDKSEQHSSLSRRISLYLFARSRTNEGSLKTEACITVAWAGDNHDERCWQYMRNACVALKRF
jgi:hypothetical protein